MQPGLKDSFWYGAFSHGALFFLLLFLSEKKSAGFNPQ
jgi:hypothetical protein